MRRKLIVPVLIMSFAAASAAWTAPALTEVEPELKPELHLLTDGIIAAGALLLNTADIIIEKAAPTQAAVPAEVINGLDGLLMFPYSGPVDKASDIILYTALASPALFAAVPDSDWFTLELSILNRYYGAGD